VAVARPVITSHIRSRIEWCRRQRIQARTQPELEGWRAEEEGLQDAILNRDHTNQYRYSPPDVFERYAMGLEDGRALICLARLDLYLAVGLHEEGRICDPGDHLREELLQPLRATLPDSG
jgi:hypothetical protein